MKHRVVPAPEQQDWAVESSEGGGRSGECVMRGIGGQDGDVSDEVSDCLASFSGSIGGIESDSMLSGRHAGRPRHESRRASAAQVDEAPRGGDQRWDGDVVRLRHCGVAQHQRRDIERSRCSDGDRTTPVVGGENDGADDLGLTEGDQLGDPLAKPSGASSLGVPHPYLIDGDDPPVVAELAKQVPPCIGPGGVAVDADDGALRAGSGVEDVKVHRTAIGPVDDHPAGPGGVKAPRDQLLGGRGERCCNCHGPTRAVRRRRS